MGCLQAGGSSFHRIMDPFFILIATVCGKPDVYPPDIILPSARRCLYSSSGAHKGMEEGCGERRDGDTAAET